MRTAIATRGPSPVSARTFAVRRCSDTASTSDGHPSRGADVTPGRGGEEHRGDAEPRGPERPGDRAPVPGAAVVDDEHGRRAGRLRVARLDAHPAGAALHEGDLAVAQGGEVARPAAGVLAAGDRADRPRRAPARRVGERPHLAARRQPAAAGERDPRRAALVEVGEPHGLDGHAPPGLAERIDDVRARRLVAGRAGRARPALARRGGEGVEVRRDVSGADRSRHLRRRRGCGRGRRCARCRLVAPDEHDRHDPAGDRGHQHRHRRDGPPRTHTWSVAARRTLGA